MLVVILESADAAHESTCTREEKVKVYDWENRGAACLRYQDVNILLLSEYERKQKVHAINTKERGIMLG